MIAGPRLYSTSRPRRRSIPPQPPGKGWRIVEQQVTARKVRQISGGCAAWQITRKDIEIRSCLIIEAIDRER
ncbi:MAG TPA: hypothetical protein DCY27_03740 [Desulfobacterales bacterium]|nr:hypothetical protein [Desulfobacterales bacterium]